jgi:RimJ/RimL family protein N-acetyltransferase
MSEQECLCYEYSEEMVKRYIQIQREWKRVTLAILCKDEIVGEIILKNIEEHKCATMSITLKNPTFKDRGIGTAAEKLAVDYVFREMNIPTLYADTIQSNTRSQRVLKKIGFILIGEDKDYKYYRIDRSRR